MTSAAPTSLSMGERLVIGVCLLAGLTEVVVPALIPRQPSHQVDFAWEMYSKGPPPLQLTILTEGGGEWTVEPGDLVPTVRAEIDYAAVLPAFLCETRPEAEAIRVRSGDETWDHRCR